MEAMVLVKSCISKALSGSKETCAYLEAIALIPVKRNFTVNMVRIGLLDSREILFGLLSSFLKKLFLAMLSEHDKKGFRFPTNPIRIYSQLYIPLVSPCISKPVAKEMDEVVVVQK